MTKAEEAKAKIDALRWAMSVARFSSDLDRWDFTETVEQEIVMLQRQARTAAVPA
jgi:hypothetical protein